MKSELKMPKIDLKYQLVTSALPSWRTAPSTSSRLDDEQPGSPKQVSFTITHFVTANRFVTKRAAKIGTLADLKGKTIVSAAGTTNIKQITEINAQQNRALRKDDAAFVVANPTDSGDPAAYK